MAQIESNYDEGQLRQSMDTLQKAHPFLQSLIAEETDTGRLYYQIQDYLNIPVMVKEEVFLWQQDYEEISVCGWNVKKECLLKIVVYPKEKEFQILFIAHHLLCDGRGLLQLAGEFAEHYANGIMPPFTSYQQKNECAALLVKMANPVFALPMIVFVSLSVAARAVNAPRQSVFFSCIRFGINITGKCP